MGTWDARLKGKAMPKHTVSVRSARDLPESLRGLLSDTDRDALAIVERVDGLFIKLCAIAHDPVDARERADAYARIYGATRA